MRDWLLHMFLRTPLSPRRNRLTAEVTGPACSPMDVIADGDVAVMIVTLVGWRAALAGSVSRSMALDAEEMERVSTRLLRGWPTRTGRIGNSRPCRRAAGTSTS